MLAANSIPGLPSIIHADEETWKQPDYFWENRPRRPESTFVLQRTLAGQAFLKTGSGKITVKADQAMVFRYGESTAYGIGPPDTWPYQNQYIVLESRGGLGELLAQIRAEFGDVLRMDRKGEAARILEVLVKAFRCGQAWDHLELAELAYRLLLALYREQISGTRGSDPVAFLRHQLKNQFRSPKNMKEWMHDLPVSREHMTRVFHERYGESPAAYLRRLRLEHARLLARTSTNLPAEDIASASGFVSAQTLRRAFRKQFGHPLGAEQALH